MGQSRVSRRWWWAGGVLLVAALGGVVEGRAAEGQRFQFRPASGTVQATTTRTAQTMVLGDGRTSARETEITVKATITKTDSGHAVRAVITDGSTQGGAADADPMLKALKGMPLTYVIGEDAKMQSVMGLEAVVTRMKKTFPPAVAAAVEKSLTPELLLLGEKSDWDSLVADFVGRSAEVGEAWVAAEKYPLPDGQICRYFAAKKVIGRAKAQGRDLLRVQVRFSSDPQELRQFLGEAAATALTGLAPVKGGAKVSGEGVRMVDPETLLWYDGTLTRHIAATLALPGAGETPLTLILTKRYQVQVETPK